MAVSVKRQMLILRTTMGKYTNERDVDWRKILAWIAGLWGRKKYIFHLW